MNYYVGVPITYTASASTVGRPSDSYTYSWTFDDGSTATGASVVKTWGTEASHAASVEAQNLNTGGTGSASKTITVSAIPTKFGQGNPNIAMGSTLQIVTASMYGGNPGISSDDYAISFSNNTAPQSGFIGISGDATLQVIANTRLYVSTDSGASFALVVTPGYNTFSNVAISRNGNLMAVSENTSGGSGGYIWVSQDGSTWSQSSIAAGDFRCLAVSADGVNIYSYNGLSGFVRSIDSGNSFSASATPFGNKNVRSLACSDSGAIVFACADDQNNTGTDYIYKSVNYGANYTPIAGAGKRAWTWIHASGDGSIIAACLFGSTSYFYLSLDGGATWNTNIPAGSRNWRDVHVSRDGSTLVARYFDGFVYQYLSSFDSGVTWI